MAKGKRAAALFEVIHKDKRFDRKVGSTGALRAPRWLFKGKTRPADPASGPAPLDPTSVSAADDAAPTNVGLAVDPERQQISLRLSYTSAGITAFALIVAVVLAYLVGTRLSDGPAAASASPSVEQLRQQPPQPDVLDVSRDAEPRPAPDGAPAAGTQTQPVPQAPPTLLAQGAQRQNNLNYVVIQSYPDKADAQEACDLLARNGVGATIEQGLRGLHPQWYIVVGTDGFAGISSPDYAGYIKRIERISSQSYSSKRSFKAFQPMGYKWDRAGR